MAQQWVALIYSGSSGTVMPCTFLPTLSFHQQTALRLAAVRWKEPHALAVTQTTAGWLPVWLYAFSGQGENTEDSAWYLWLFAMLLEKTCAKQQKNWNIKRTQTVCWLFSPESRSDYIHHHFQEMSPMLRQNGKPPVTPHALGLALSKCSHRLGWHLDAHGT